MKIEVSAADDEDIASAYTFYERQAPELGTYFLESIFRISTRCVFMRAYIRSSMVRTAAFRVDFLSQYTTVPKPR
jgi:hypothetical protein